MSLNHLALVQAYHPATFPERGVLVPFTTPLLVGARARPAERDAVELVVPNPSGGRGVYILPWTGVRDLCRPTVHDSRLNERVASLPAITPASVRLAARSVAAEGFGGREAAAAALAAAKAEEEGRLLSNFMLLLELVRRVDGGGAEGVRPSEVEQRARRAVAHVAPQLGRRPDQVAQHLEELGTSFTSIGIGGTAEQARVPRLIQALTALGADMEAWIPQNDDSSGDCARLVGEAAALTLSCVRQTLAEARALTEDMVGLLRAWAEAPEGVARVIARPEWLLDGWEQIYLLWQTADSITGPRARLSEMAVLVPMIPREALGWIGVPLDIEAPGRHGKTVAINEDWRLAGRSLDLIARNERLRAMAA